MMTPKEIFLELLERGGRPERLLRQYEAFQMALGDPVNRYLREGRVRGSKTVDPWGVTMLFPEDAPGAIPLHGEDTTVLKDITRWKEVVHAPDIEAHCQEGWEEYRLQQYEKAGDQRLVTGFMGTGIFEQCHFLMGFESTLTNLYEHPKEMHELIDYITDYRIRFVRMLIDGLRPEIVFTHDDWGTKTQLFMKPDIWREFFKEPYRRFYGTIRDAGCIAIHHADSYLVPILDDMAEIGIQCWQGILPENDIPAVIEHMDGRMIVMGGVGAEIDRKDAGEEEIRTYMRRMLRQNGSLGHFIPSITYGMRGTIYPHVDPLIDEEIDRYNRQLHFPKYHFPVTKRRFSVLTEDYRGKSGASAQQPGAAISMQDTSPLGRARDALVKGNRSRTLKACEAALDAGIPAQQILNDGLLAGMTEVGDAFSKGNLFVPEMLMSAKCMTAALDLLKPHLTADSGESIGRVCIGTVRGDLHDIGKNLVKIMLEGSGFDVIDLGSDVSAETFVQTAKEQHCDFICCSALLTTTMEEMRRVVELAKAEGIRDSVKIMVGGAPVTQEYCDSIGADIYTEDAASAAKAAAAAMRSA